MTNRLHSGGRVDYGEEHSRFHGHDRYGELYPVGLLSDWDEAHPIVIIAHSLGGNTAWVLQNYLELQRFPGQETSSRWISGNASVCPSSLRFSPC